MRSLRLLRILLLAAAMSGLTPAAARDSAAPVADVLQVAAGRAHTCLLNRQGSVSCWGANEHGELGLGDTSLTTRNTPVPVTGLGAGVRAIAAGYFHTCALTAAGGVKCWGWNLFGSLGDGSDEIRATPVDVIGLGSGVASVSGGAAHSCAVTSAGAMKCWGANGNGQLGDGSTTDRFTPVDVIGLSSGVASLDAGEQHTCAVLASGALKCWGDNETGQLGDNSRIDRSAPVDVQGLVGAVARVGGAARHTCAVSTAGAVRCWGDLILNGDPNTEGSLVARPVPGLDSGYVAIDAGTFHTCVLRSSGAMKCVGDNSSGQFGSGEIESSFDAVDVVGLDAGVTTFSAGGAHNCAVGGRGGLQCWGLNTDGQLGIGVTNKRLTPTQVVGLETGMAAVGAGSFHGCALTTGGGVKCWGGNNQNQLGDGTNIFRLNAVDVIGLGSGVRALAVGFDHNCAITSDRRAKCWGGNFDGRLGNGQTLNSAIPVDVLGLGSTPVVALAQGLSHGCALLEGGAVKCWGVNEFGQVGNNTTTTQLTAVDVVGLGSGVRTITAGAYHSCAITAVGALKCWGINNVGQLGDGTTVNRLVPTDVVGLGSGVIAVGGAYEHSCAVITGGAVKCWGAHFFGTLLGDGSEVNRSVPGDVPALRSGVVEIALGAAHSCVRLDRGAMQCWGSNYHGPIGDNSEIARPTPVDVAGMSRGVSAIDLGLGGQSCAVVAGAAKCWGENTFGQVGDGTTHGVPTPQAVLTDELLRRVGPVVPIANDASLSSQSDASGRYVVFQSRASNLIEGDSNAAFDVFRTDRERGTTQRVSVDNSGAQIVGASIEPSVSADGSLVVFVAADAAVGKVLGESPAQGEQRRKTTAFAVYMRNMVGGTTQRMGTALSGGAGTQPQVAPGGTAVVFTSNNSGTSGGTPSQANVYYVPLTRDGAVLVPGTTRCVSCKTVSSTGADTGTDANGESRNAVVSADGRQVAFETHAKNALAASPTPCPGSSAEIMLRDLITGAMQRMSPPPTTPPTNCGTVGSTAPSIDYAGTTLAFQTDQSLQSSDANSVADVYAIRLAEGTAPERISEDPDGIDGNGVSTAPRVSGDGRSVVFVSTAQNLDLSFGDNNDRADIHTARLDTDDPVARLSRTTSGAEIDAASERPALNYDGTKLAFDSTARALDADNIGGQSGIFQRNNPLAPPPRSATWWKASESGWGLTVFDQGEVLAPTWFTYDGDGEPTWFIVGGAFPQPDGSYRGDLLRFTGVRFDQINGAAATSVTPIGNVVLRYGGEDALAFEYTALGTTQTKTLNRFPFGTRGFSCSTSPSAARDSATNYTDLWTGGDVADAGWGLTVFHIDDGVFAIWYTYDLDGEAVFFVISAARQADGSFSGPVFKQRNGTPFLQIDGLPPSADADTVGSASFRFTDGDSATFSYALAGVSQSKAIVRLVVGPRPTVCTGEDLPPTQ